MFFNKKEKLPFPVVLDKMVTLSMYIYKSLLLIKDLF